MSDADISTLTTAYTVPAGSEARLTASFCNRSTSATATVQLWVVPQGESRGDQHLKESGTTLGLAGTAQAVLERSFVAPTGCIVYVQASTANVSCQVQGDVVDVSSQSFTDGTSSIVYGTNWGGYLTQTTLIKTANGQVFLNLSVLASGTPIDGGVVATLPTGYRPSVLLQGSPVGTFYLQSSGVTYPASFTLTTAGDITYAPLPTSLTIPPANGSQCIWQVSFFAA